MTSISLALAFLAAPVSAAAAPPRLPDTCGELARSDPKRALDVAADWQVKGGGLDARQCLALAYAQLGQWPSAAIAFEQAAHEAEASKDGRLADFRVESGNAWLAAGEAAKARASFDAALATTLLAPQLRGETHLDRARAEAALGDVAAARSDIDKGLELVPADAFAWYLSAALARRQNDLKRAQDHIARAVGLAPDDASILLEAGNIAGLSGEIEAANGLFARAARAAPDSEAGRAAQAALAVNAQAGAQAPAAPPK